MLKVGGKSRAGRGERGRSAQNRLASIPRLLLTSLGGERRLVANESAYPCHDIVDVLRSRQLDLLVVLVLPSVVQSHSRRHGRVVLNRTEFSQDAVELIEIVEEVEY